MIELLNGRIDLEDGFVIKEYYTEYGNVRILYNSDVRQSVSFIDKQKKYSLCDFYFSFYDLPVMLNPNGKDYLVLGGGGFTYPKYYIAKYKDKNMDVVEINEKCVEYAKKYFYLDDLYNRFDFERKRLNIIIDDAIKYIDKCKKKYDFILVDLFNGSKMVNETFENKCLNKLNSMLLNGGIIAINYMISDNNKYIYKEQIKNIIKSMKKFKIITNTLYFNENSHIGNVIILLSNNNIKISSIFVDFEDISSLFM